MLEGGGSLSDRLLRICLDRRSLITVFSSLYSRVAWLHRKLSTQERVDKKDISDMREGSKGITWHRALSGPALKFEDPFVFLILDAVDRIDWSRVLAA